MHMMYIFNMCISGRPKTMVGLALLNGFLRYMNVVFVLFYFINGLI